MNLQIFRMYDIRGKYPGQINEREVFDIAIRLSGLFKYGGKIVIGCDARLSSPALFRSLKNGLSAAGFKVISLGLITTPMLNFFVKLKKADGGVVITASHNPKGDNGLSIVDRTGMSIGGMEILKKIKNQSAKIKIKYKKLKILGKFNQTASSRDLTAYPHFLEKLFNVAKPLKIVVDCSNGAAGPVIKSIKFPDKIKPVFVNTIPNGRFPAHGPDPTANNAYRQLAKEVIKNKADIGVAFDGDGDRALFVDNKGNVVRPEHAWRMLMISDPQPAVAFTVICGYAMELVAKTLVGFEKIRRIKTKVGHLFLKAICRKESKIIGIESSMHYYFPDDNFSGSGILAMIKILNALSILPYQLSDIVKMLPKTERIPEINRKFFRKKLPALYLKVKKVFRGKAGRIYFLDGVSVYTKDWWFNLRPSNTENLVRINIEGLERKKVLFLKKELLKLID